MNWHPRHAEVRSSGWSNPPSEAFTAREWAHIHMCARRFTVAELCGMEDVCMARGDHDAAARYRWAVAIRAIDGGEEG